MPDNKKTTEEKCVEEKSKELKPLGTNVLLRGITKESTIIIQTKDGAPPKAQIEKIVVDAAGIECEYVSVGDEVHLSPAVLNDPTKRIDLKQKDNGQSIYFWVVKEEEIIGIFN